MKRKRKRIEKKVEWNPEPPKELNLVRIPDEELEAKRNKAYKLIVE